MIHIQLQHPRWKTRLKPYCKTVREACEAALLSRKKVEITVVLADDTFVQELNKTYRGKDKPTNVLSFPNHDESPDNHLGDIVLALETIEREAKEQEKTVRSHAQHLLVHGVLHLCGYDHERQKDAEIMEGLEVKVLKKLGVENPYL